MGLILLLVVLVLLFGGGGFYMGAPYHYYGGGLGAFDPSPTFQPNCLLWCTTRPLGLLSP
jgi:hypothetical protein